MPLEPLRPLLSPKLLCCLSMPCADNHPGRLVARTKNKRHEGRGAINFETQFGVGVLFLAVSQAW